MAIPAISDETREYIADTTAWLYGRVSLLQDAWDAICGAFERDRDLESARRTLESAYEGVEGMSTFLSVAMGQADADLEIYEAARHAFLFSHEPPFAAVLKAGLAHPQEDVRRCARVLEYARALHWDMQQCILARQFVARSEPRATKQEYLAAGDIPAAAAATVERYKREHFEAAPLAPEPIAVEPKSWVDARSPRRDLSDLMPVPSRFVASESEWAPGKAKKRRPSWAAMAFGAVAAFATLVWTMRDRLGGHLVDIVLSLNS